MSSERRASRIAIILKENKNQLRLSRLAREMKDETHQDIYLKQKQTTHGNR